ncbi:hypothetical protein BDA99DRAFT_597329 [Phascolomyces articulosus]|uniref:Uncharacterized protein n=1 Tax=Phascolomyces articulosus TaxID=60185 RepID=A0AAD5K526_9FUNG|nr:hypothetical protein BDA99DRAFT_597329 [Phascolomyces articulosus]
MESCLQTILRTKRLKGRNLMMKKCETAARIVNVLRPYNFPKSTSDKDDDDDSEEEDAITIHQCAPLAAITNAMAAITSKREVLDPKKRHEVFGAIFNMKKTRQALASRKLRSNIALRIQTVILSMYSGLDTKMMLIRIRRKQVVALRMLQNRVWNQNRIRRSLKRERHSRKRKGSRNRKAKEGRNIKNKKNKEKNKKRKAASKETKTVKDEGMKLHLHHLNANVTNLTNALAVLRRKHLTFERNCADIGREFTKVTKAKQWNSVMYTELQTFRQIVTGIEEEIGITQRNLNSTRNDIQD